jgi:hypothetical protein
VSQSGQIGEEDRPQKLQYQSSDLVLPSRMSQSESLPYMLRKAGRLVSAEGIERHLQPKLIAVVRDDLHDPEGNLGRLTRPVNRVEGFYPLCALKTSRREAMVTAALETDFQDMTSVSHKPSSSRIRKGDRPEAAHPGQLEPSTSFVGSPGGWS